MGALILSMASDTPLRKVYNTILPGFAIVMLPPFIDYYVLGLSGAELFTYMRTTVRIWNSSTRYPI